MEKIGVSLKTLYDTTGQKLKYGEIVKDVDGEWEYYDLLTFEGTVCMDGEECEVIKRGNDEIILRSVEEDDTFVLTDSEFKIATFKS